MAIHDLQRRLQEAFARLNERIDGAEDAAIAREHSGGASLGAELAQARAMLDVLATRLSAITPGERGDLGTQLSQLRDRFGEAQRSYDAAQATVGARRSEDEQHSRAVLDEVQDGLFRIVSEMNARFAGHPPAPSA
jgi:hypothetical protein